MGYSHRSSNLGVLPGVWFGCKDKGSNTSSVSGTFYLSVNTPIYASAGCLQSPAVRQTQRYGAATMQSWFPKMQGIINPADNAKSNYYIRRGAKKHQRKFDCAQGEFTCTSYTVNGVMGHFDSLPSQRDPFKCWSTQGLNYGKRNPNPAPNVNPCIYVKCEDKLASNYGALGKACEYAPCQPERKLLWVLRANYNNTVQTTNIPTRDVRNNCQLQAAPTAVSGATWKLESRKAGCTNTSYFNSSRTAYNVHDQRSCGSRKRYGCRDERYQEYDANANVSSPASCKTLKLDLTKVEAEKMACIEASIDNLGEYIKSWMEGEYLDQAGNVISISSLLDLILDSIYGCMEESTYIKYAIQEGLFQ